MSSKIKVEKKGKGGAGKFFLGLFLGIILGLGAVFGVGFFAYKKVSASFIRKKFGVDIDLGSDKLNNMVIEDILSNAMDVLKNTDTYSLNDLEVNFGISIGNDISGIDITDLKSVGLKNIEQAAKDKFNNISAKELEGAITFDEDVNKILNKKSTYYYNATDGKLYEDAEYKTKADFNYTIESGKVKIKHFEDIFTITAGKAELTLKYLPLTKAIGRYVSNLGETLTIAELKSDFNVKLPSYFENIDQNTKINELESAIDDLYIYELMGYKKSGTKYYEDKNKNNVLDEGEELTSIMSTVCAKKVSELDSLEASVKDMAIADVLDYTFDNGKYYSDSEKQTQVTGIMAKVAKFKVNELNTEIDKLTIADIMDYTVTGEGEGQVVTDKDGKVVTGVMKKLATTTVGNMGNIKSTIDAMTIADVLDYKKSGDTYYKDNNNNDILDSGEELKGVMKVLAEDGTTVSGLTNKVQSLKIYEVLGYKYDGTEYYIDDNNNGQNDSATEDKEKVSKLMQTIANKTIDELGGTVEGLTVADVFELTPGKGVLSLIPSDTEIEKIPEELEAAIKSKGIGELIGSGVITLSDTTQTSYNLIAEKWYNAGSGYVQVKTLTVSQLLTVSITGLSAPGVLEDSNPNA